jgi:hypothetical protein
MVHRDSDKYILSSLIYIFLNNRDFCFLYHLFPVFDMDAASNAPGIKLQ